MRHKIMLALEDMQVELPAMVEDVVEADETYVPESQKGTKFGPDASRKPRKRGTSASKRGLSSEQICICTAVQRKTGDLIVKSENRARPSGANVVDIYTGHVQKGTLFPDGRHECVSEAGQDPGNHGHECEEGVGKFLQSEHCEQPSLFYQAPIYRISRCRHQVFEPLQPRIQGSVQAEDNDWGTCGNSLCIQESQEGTPLWRC